jgi:hypothetical protein
LSFGYKLNLALEKIEHLSLISGYLLENHVWKSDYFSLNFVKFLAIVNLKKHLILALLNL